MIIQDVSEYDTSVSFTAHDGYIIRTYDGTEPDKKVHQWRDACAAAGKPFIYYAFYDWFYPAPDQVEKALAVASDKRYAFDVERWLNYQYPKRANLLAGMKQLCDTYKTATGKTAIFYFNVECLLYLKPIPDWLLACPLWIADWRGNPKPYIAPFADYAMWQQSEDPDLSVLNPNLKLDEFFEVKPPPLSKVDILWREAGLHGWNLNG
jgi:GH25 family lysozyme M1 (1,4-beta-N-acetylmuramidase)